MSMFDFDTVLAIVGNTAGCEYEDMCQGISQCRRADTLESCHVSLQENTTTTWKNRLQ